MNDTRNQGRPSPNEEAYDQQARKANASPQPIDPKALEAELNAAIDLVGDLCAGRKQWRMCIPVQPSDPDVVLSTALRRARTFIAQAEEERKCHDAALGEIDRANRRALAERDEARAEAQRMARLPLAMRDMLARRLYSDTMPSEPLTVASDAARSLELARIARETLEGLVGCQGRPIDEVAGDVAKTFKEIEREREEFKKASQHKAGLLQEAIRQGYVPGYDLRDTHVQQAAQKAERSAQLLASEIREARDRLAGLVFKWEDAQPGDLTTVVDVVVQRFREMQSQPDPTQTVPVYHAREAAKRRLQHEYSAGGSEIVADAIALGVKAYMDAEIAQRVPR